jgi:DNA-binding transcriptional LysR family regulator
VVPSTGPPIRRPSDQGEVSRRPTRRPAPTLDQARAFVAVAASGTYREAARKLGFGDDHVPVIRLVARFTDVVALGKLVSASRRGEVALTSPGLRVLPAAQRMVQAAEALSHIHDEIRFSSYPAIAGRLVAAAPDLLEADEQLVFHDVSEHNRADGGIGLVERTTIGELDIVVAPTGLSERVADVGIREEEVYSWRLEVVLPGGSLNELHRRAVVRPRRLARYRIVCAPVGHKSRELLERVFAEDGVLLDVATESANQEVLFHIAVNSTTLAAVLPSDSFAQRTHGKEPDRLGPELAAPGYHPRGHYSVYSLWPRDPQQPTEREQAVDRLVARVVGALGEANDSDGGRSPKQSE